MQLWIDSVEFSKRVWYERCSSSDIRLELGPIIIKSTDCSVEKPG